MPGREVVRQLRFALGACEGTFQRTEQTGYSSIQLMSRDLHKLW